MEDAEISRERADSSPESEDTSKSIHEELSFGSDFNDLSSLSSCTDGDISENSSDEDDQSGSDSVASMPALSISDRDGAQFNKPEPDVFPLHSHKDGSTMSLNLTTNKDIQAAATTLPQKKKLVITDSLENGVDAEESKVTHLAARVTSHKPKSVLKRFGPTRQDAKPIETIHGVVPVTKAAVTDGERGEQWDFQEGTFRRTNLQSVEKPKLNSTKKVLKLQLSEVQHDWSLKHPDTADGEEHSESDNEEYDTTNTQTDAPRQDCGRFSTTENLNFILCDSNEQQCLEWRRAFGETDGVKIIQGNIFDHQRHCDAVIIPGNSFGFLDGEPEIKFTEAYGWRLQENILNTIRNEYHGELLVGQAVITPIEACGNTITSRANSGCQNDYPRYAIYTPIMRVPLYVGDTPNAYLAFRAAILAACQHHGSQDRDKISTVLCPSLCNGFGGMHPGRITSQMKAAYDAFVTQKRTDLAKPTGLGPMATCHVQMTTKIGNWC